MRVSSRTGGVVAVLGRGERRVHGGVHLRIVSRRLHKPLLLHQRLLLLHMLAHTAQIVRAQLHYDIGVLGTAQHLKAFY